MQTDYQPPFWLRNGHLNTLYIYLFRKVKGVVYQRSRIQTDDDDFLDLDFSKQGSNTIVLITHGLEGDSQTAYMQGMVKQINGAGWDAVALNQRGCSGEPNRLYSSYNSGKTDDIDTVVRYLTQQEYQQIFLMGFSLGGNIMLKYAGEKGSAIDTRIKAVVGVSVPCDLAGSARQMAKPISYFYLHRLLRKLKQKAIAKKVRFPEAPFSTSQIKACRDFESFDDVYTAPAHGYKDAADYYAQCSSNQFIPSIKIPALLITAKDDPFLSSSCYPLEEAASNTNFQVDMQTYGGHVGFAVTNLDSPLYSEIKVVEFFSSHIS